MSRRLFGKSRSASAEAASTVRNSFGRHGKPLVREIPAWVHPSLGLPDVWYFSKSAARRAAAAAAAAALKTPMRAPAEVPIRFSPSIETVVVGSSCCQSPIRLEHALVGTLACGHGRACAYCGIASAKHSCQICGVSLHKATGRNKWPCWQKYHDPATPKLYTYGDQIPRENHVLDPAVKEILQHEDRRQQKVTPSKRKHMPDEVSLVRVSEPILKKRSQPKKPEKKR